MVGLQNSWQADYDDSRNQDSLSPWLRLWGIVPGVKNSLGPPIKWQVKLFFLSLTGSKNLSLISEHSLRSKWRVSVRNTKFIAPYFAGLSFLSICFRSRVEPRSEKLVKGTCINAFIWIEKWNQTSSNRKIRA